MGRWGGRDSPHVSMDAINNAAQIIRKHYGLNRAVTPQEVDAEIANLRRRGQGNLDHNQKMLAAKLDLFKPNAHDAMGDNKPVPIFDANGNKIGEVSKTATSIGASKVAGFPVKFGLSDGIRGWVPIPKRKNLW